MSARNYKLRTLRSLADKTFIVEKYQRGYKWGIKEVEDLLFDINSFDKDNQAFYCLQPIVVTKVGPKTFELIDGQQRLTTSYLIAQCLNLNIFKLHYNTRSRSTAFLEGVRSLETLEIQGEKRQALNNEWGNFIEKYPNKDNVDNYHFFTAYQIIANWIEALNPEERAVFTEKFFSHTKVIWYRIISQQTPEEIFINFNQGKIHLEQAELIKALFVLQLKKEHNTEVKAYKTNQFADEWNTIENYLQEDKFWFFVSNDVSDKRRANRIDLLFDIICNKPKKEQNNLFSYNIYLEKLNYETLDSKDWQKVKDLYSLLYEWYHDRATYHLLGLVIYLNIKTILDVYNEYNTLHNKNAFLQTLKQWLRSRLNYKDSSSTYCLQNLSYDTPKATLEMLIIFNVATYQISAFNYYFPFDKLKTQRWSLEHIHAQKSEEFKIIREVRDWLDDVKILLDVVTDDTQNDSIKNKTIELEEAIRKLDSNSLIPKTIRPLSKEINQFIDKQFNVHSIKNLCLLDGPTNSAISNSNFREKRRIIIEIDRLGEVESSFNGKVKTFIPICSKNVFLKFYTKDSEKVQFTYWGHIDKDDYEDSIDHTITNYLYN